MLEILPIPAFEDNYIWLLHDNRHAAVVDPGDADAVINVLKARNLILNSILVTHHHADHIGGIPLLERLYQPTITAPACGVYEFPHQGVHEGDIVHIEALHLALQVMEVPGHTLDHIAYFSNDILLCGDTLFSSGCGRLFEGSAAQMYDSLQKLAALPKETKVYCTHEYTSANIAFALTLEPDNEALKQKATAVKQLRAHAMPSLPTSIDIELQTNPFLRCHTESIRSAVSKDAHLSDIEIFRQLRIMKDLI